MSSILNVQKEQSVGEVSSYDREEEYRLAQQAGAEAVTIGRETLETVVRQGEQLQNAENMADDTVFTVDKANRILRGMTWSGWIANKFSKSVTAPEYRNQNGETDDGTSRVLKPIKPYETVPEACVGASQSVLNYHANLQVLEDCETDELRGTCRVICDDMYRQACMKITEILEASETGNDSAFDCVVDDKAKSFALQLKEDLSYLRQRQFVLQQISRAAPTKKATTTADEKSKLFDGSTKKEDTPKPSSPTDKIAAQQEQHLNVMSEQFRELGFLASNINISAERQAELVDSLDSKNETLHFKMNIMNRKTEQLIKKKSWGQHKSEFLHYASIRHQSSGLYLSIAPDDDTILILSNVLNEKCIFGVYKRRRLLGFQNKFSRKWVGQNLLGQLNCGATAFNRRQEWEADGELSDTTLLIVSAGWGAGGYLLLNKEGEGTQPVIGGGDFATKKLAPKWCINEFHEPR